MPGGEAQRQLAPLAVQMLPIIGAQMDQVIGHLGEQRVGPFEEHIESMGLCVAPYVTKQETTHE